MSAPRRALDRHISESEWQREVIAIAHAGGWSVMHVRRSRSSHLTATSLAGWPDLVLFRPGRLLFRELKRDGGKLRPEQAEVLDGLAAAGADVDVWRPADRAKVEATLRGSRLLGAWTGR